MNERKKEEGRRKEDKDRYERINNKQIITRNTTNTEGI